MGIGPIVRRLLAKDKVNPERSGPRHSGVPFVYQGKQYYRDTNTGQAYYVDDDGERHETWIPPWGENPS